MERRKRQLKTTILLLLIICFLLCLCVILYDRADTLSGEALYRDIGSKYGRTATESERIPDEGMPSVSNDDVPEQSDGVIGQAPAHSTSAGMPEYQSPVDFAGLAEDGVTAIAWLYCGDTVIDYPVLQAEDNAYYVTHSATGEKNKLGALFLDYRNAPDFSDQNLTIYGHRMKSGRMFGTLEKYKKQAYYEKHPVMTLYTPKAEYTVELFAGYVAYNFTLAYTTNFKSDAAFAEYIAMAKKNSTFQSNVEVSSGDRILTLSTCTSESEKARYLILGKLTQKGA